MSNEIPEQLRLFIRRNFNSVSLLDVLFLLKRDEKRKWTPEEVSLEMRTNLSYATAQLTELVALKLVSSREGTFSFSPVPADSDFIEELELLYNARRSTVINFIYSQPIDSIRNFADAFKLKKD